jgi:hypothetical protein
MIGGWASNNKFARALKLSLSSDKLEEVFSRVEIETYKKAMKFYSDLRRSVKIRYHEEVDIGKYEKQMQKLSNTRQLTKLLPLQGALLIAIIPRAMPWARSFCPFRACGANLGKFFFYSSFSLLCSIK